MVETSPPSSLAVTVETTPPLPPPQSVKTAERETQTEREDRESPERKRKKMTTRVTEAEILRDSSEDPNDASLEITDDEEENPTLQVTYNFASHSQKQQPELIKKSQEIV